MLGAEAALAATVTSNRLSSTALLGSVFISEFLDYLTPVLMRWHTQLCPNEEDMRESLEEQFNAFIHEYHRKHGEQLHQDILVWIKT